MKTPEDNDLAKLLHQAARHLNELFRMAARNGLVINGTFSRSRYQGDAADSSVLRIRVLKEIGEQTGGAFSDSAEPVSPRRPRLEEMV